MAGPSSSGGNPNASGDGVLYGMLALIVGGALYGIWYLFSHEITIFVKIVKHLELQIINIFFDDPQVKDFIRFFDRVGDDKITWPHAAKAAEITGRYLKIPIAGLMLGFCIWVIFLAPGSRFKKVHGLEQLIAAQAKTWPVISPIVKFNPAAVSARAPGSAVPTKLPPFAESLSPEEFIAYHRIKVEAGLIDKVSALSAFTQQLGGRWPGAKKLPIHLQAVFAGIALKGARKRKESDDLMGEIAMSFKAPNGLIIKGKLKEKIRKIINDPTIGGEAEKIAARHAFTSTAMLGLLAWARQRGGVLAPAQFVWLRAVDRALWYPLNNLGRRAFLPEASGAMSHYYAELAAARPLLTPKLDRAVEALEEFYKINVPKIPPLDTGNDAKSAKKK
ncbi:MAG: hypothetical protein ACOYK8_03535 [Alphaproteobacteria bacterium]